MSPVRTAVRVAGRWYDLASPPVLPDVVTPPDPVADLIVGETQPTAGLVGAGVIRPAPTIIVNGNVTVQSGQVYADRIINGRVTILGDGVLENCIVRGAAAEPTGVAYLVTTSGATPTSATVPLTLVLNDDGTTRAPTAADTDPASWVPNPAVKDNVRYCTLEPQTPSAWWNAFGTKFTRAYACSIRRVVDGWRVYSTTDGYVGTRIRACLGRGLSHFAPDYGTGNRTRTHNDWVQAESNTGPVWDFVIQGNDLDARHDPVVGTQPAVYSELAAVMLTANLDATVGGVVVRAINATIDANWLTGGVNTINAGKAVTAGGYAKIIWTRNRHERPGSIPAGGGAGPTVAFGLDPNFVLVNGTGNTYIDTGTTVPRTNG